MIDSSVAAALFKGKVSEINEAVAVLDKVWRKGDKRGRGSPSQGSRAHGDYGQVYAQGAPETKQSSGNEQW